jgi:alpha-L-fucosidase
MNLLSSSTISTLAAVLALAVILVACQGDSDTPQTSNLLCPPHPTVAEPPEVPYNGTPDSLAKHEVPEWFDDAKFGIMIHWGLYSVPAWAETTLDPEIWVTPLMLMLFGQEWYKRNPYAEWYANTIKINDSEAQAYHQDRYGIDFAYDDFQALFEERSAPWVPGQWADLFRQAGARYVVLVTKHHDGFALWPSNVEHPFRSGWFSRRDFVGELSAAVRSRCMRMGLYYSGGIDWTFEPKAIQNLPDFLTSLPGGPEYAAYVDAHWRELIERYRPAVLWNDINYPNAAEPLELFAHYYNTVPDGVINDRWALIPGLIHHDYITPEYRSLSQISVEKFETVRGMGRSFGYNRNEGAGEYLSAEELIHQFVDVVSKNGNLLLNVGPMADGTIPKEQVERLQVIGQWLKTNGEAFFGSRPWVRAEGTTSGGTPVRFTQRIENGTVYATVLGPLSDGTVTIENFPENPSHVGLLGFSAPLTWLTEDEALRIILPGNLPDRPAYSFAISGVR